MSYYDYEPNSGYYYDEYPQHPESDMTYEDPVFVDYQLSQHRRFARSNNSYVSSNSFVSSTRNSLHNYYIVSQESIPDENQYNMPHYVVPIVYGPSKVVSLGQNSFKPVKHRSMSHESIDRYFSDDKNIHKQAAAYKKIIRRKIPRDVIQEEPESLTSGSETVQFTEKERSDTDSSNKTEIPSDIPKSEEVRNTEVPCSQKKIVESKAKRNSRAKEQKSKTVKPKKIKPTEERIEDNNKEEEKKEPSEAICESNLNPLNESKEKLRFPPRRSRSTLHKKVFLSHISHMPISCIPSSTTTSKLPSSIKSGLKTSKSDTKLNQKSTRHADLQKIEIAKSVPNPTKPQNAKVDYYSISDISQCMNSNDKTKLLGWRNKSISEESTSNYTSTDSSDVSKVSNVASKNTDSVDVDTAEYEEFISSIVEKPLKTDDSLHSHFISKLFNKSFKFDKSDQSLNFGYEIDDAPVSISVTPTAISTTMTPIANLKLPERESQAEIEVKTTVSVGKNLAESKHVQVPKLDAADEGDDLKCKTPKVFKTNPFADLDISSKNLFRHDVSEDFRGDHFNSVGEGNDADKSSGKKVFFMRLIRCLGNFITSVRNISYKYVFRYILFI